MTIQSSPSRILESPSGDFRLRQLTEADSEEYFDTFDRNRLYVADHDRDFAQVFKTIGSVRQELAVFNRTRRRNFAIDVEDVFAGAVGIEIQPHHKSVIHYWIDQDHAGRGLASRASRMIIKNAFDELYIKEVKARVYAYNYASQRVVQKIGYASMRHMEYEFDYTITPDSLNPLQ